MIDPEKMNELKRRTELERQRTLDTAWQREASCLRTALGEILEVVNKSTENTAIECHVRVIATQVLYGKGETPFRSVPGTGFVEDNPDWHIVKK